ncbi:MAG: hydrogenase-4 component G [Candidatus Marinarcus sp.]|uniref:hydrogenase-4 component G n=1 Tax=Candidatus Marinarcus sp. TaxID=3100987 RepID=UPI003AFFFDA3
MEVDSNRTQLGLNTFIPTGKTTQNEELTFDETVKKSAFSISLSMSAQIILFHINTSDMVQGTALSQSALTGNQEVLDFLAGKPIAPDMDLANTGYQGKPIMDLSQDEATQLISSEGFFGVTQTSDRVSNFVFSFAQDDLELLQKGRDGIVQGFEEAKKMFGDLPEISYETQKRTLALIDERINALK